MLCDTPGAIVDVVFENTSCVSDTNASSDCANAVIGAKPITMHKHKITESIFVLNEFSIIFSSISLILVKRVILIMRVLFRIKYTK